jgi:hypothetical protein
MLWRGIFGFAGATDDPGNGRLISLREVGAFYFQRPKKEKE